MRHPIYLDYHATTPVDPRVLEAMLPYFTERFGNPASRTHRFGWDAAEAVEKAREQCARGIGATHKELVFTSGATESNNLAIKGVAHGCRERGSHVVTVATEHKSVLDSCRHLEAAGCTVTYLPVDREGLVDLDQFAAALTDETVLVSVMTANNEIGVLQPIREIAALAHARGAFVHTDAAQAIGKVPFDVDDLDVDLVSFTAHKLYGPKGVGALYIRRKRPGLDVTATMHGGGQERGLRSGTLNVPAIVGFGEAVEVSGEVMATEAVRLGELRDRLLDGLRARMPWLVVNGSLAARLPQNLNVSFPEIESESLGVALDDLAVSSGSACATGKGAPSHVLKALGLDDDLAVASIRFGLGRSTTVAEVDDAVEKVAGVALRLRELRAELGA